VERVICAHDGGQSYALYLPSTYTPERKWPVLFALDPAARGSVPVRAFREGAELYGYVVAGSHNSRNGPFEAGFNSLTAMWRDLNDLLSINNGQVYLVGFSGGARMAGEFSQMASVVNGLVACGAGFPIENQGKSVPPIYLGVSGTWDMNYLELKNVDAQLSKAKRSSRLITFDGGHQWPPSAVCVEILQWLELGAFRLGLKPADDELVERLFDQEMERIRRLERNGRLLRAYKACLNLRRDFTGVRDTSPLAEKLAALKNHKDLKKSSRLDEKIERIERRYIRELLVEFLKNDRQRELSWWQSKIRSIEKIAQHEDAPEYQLLAKRLLEFIWRNGYEKSWFAAESGATERALYLARISLLVHPEAPYLNYNLARLLALAGNREEAMSSLRKALAAGYSDRNRIDSDPAFAPFRNEAEMKRILSTLSEEP
jgi:predicted esterase